ncbi:mechanosensitive ion channel family protein [Acuticoccus sp. I52.16.1]|uniref:mechanosensitive ion channel family protein n=1 Tax=Acuticoccus sp. I52.16.1 TaxID=2928472 RepID=UPI001FD2744C|nr:mechanosensitive ion channel family protein [Acuticoccus sp. I52.16.1]UOM32573.1 mechanosensitive ion channel family protein [Acuticoccus sp. I52.16.1]
MTTSRILQPAIARAYRAALAAIVVASFAVILAGAARAQDAGAQDASASDAIPAAAASPLSVSLAATDSPLSPAPTGSPRQTLESFRVLSNAAAADLVAAFYESGDHEGSLLFDSEETAAYKRSAINNLTRAMSTMDLSAIAPTNRRTVGINSVLLLEEILDRIPLPEPGAVPDAAAVDDGAALHGWTIPGTQIQMIRSETLSGDARFLFSPETVRQLPNFYELVRTMPRMTEGQVDFYRHFVSAPGLSMPIQLYRYVLDLPPWALTIHFEQAMWQWIALVLITAVFGVLAYLVLHGEARRTSSQGVGGAIHRLLMPILVIAFLGVYRWLCDDVVNLTGDVLTYVELTVETLQTIALAALVLFAFNLVAALIISSPRIRQESLDASLIRLVMRVIGFLAAGFILFMGATRIGLPVYGIVAGLGVGGLAIALAVRPTLENFIGGIILYADRPVKVGDFCQFGSMLGTVEEIGLRSTKVRSLNRTLVTVQNSEFSQMSITNFSRRDANLMQTVVRLRHETTSEQLTAVIEGITQKLKADLRVKGDTVRVVLLDIAESAFEVEIWAYINSADYTEFLKIKQALLLKVMDVVDDNDTAFARPSQTTYLARDLSAAQHPPLEGLDLPAGSPS